MTDLVLIQFFSSFNSDSDITSFVSLLVFFLLDRESRLASRSTACRWKGSISVAPFSRSPRVCSAEFSSIAVKPRDVRPTSSSTAMTERQIYQKALLITSLGTVKRYFARFFNVIENIISFLKVILHIAAFCFRCIGVSTIDREATGRLVKSSP